MLAQRFTKTAKATRRERTIEVILEDLLGVFLGLRRGIGVVDGSLVATDDLRVSHSERSRMMKRE